MADDNFSVVTDEADLFIGEATLADEPKNEDEGSATESQEADQNEEDTATSEEEKPEAKEGHSRYQKRIDKLVRQREDAERRAAELEQELRSMKSKPAETKELDPLDFEDYDDYVEALKAQPRQKAPEPQVKEAQEDKAPEMDNVVLRRLDDAFEDARDAYEDFDDVVRDPSVPFSPAMVVALSELDNAGEVAYYLAKNKDKAKEISGMSPTKQVIELGKVSDRLTAKAEKKVSKAPDPIDPVSAKGDVIEKDPSKMSFREYEAYRKSQERKKGFW